jgi:hypothetical protein
VVNYQRFKDMKLTDIKTQEQMDSIKDWTKITYKGLNVFDEYCKICDTLLDKINEDEEMIEYAGGTIDGQECYLGWIPGVGERFQPDGVEKDCEYFTSGWDLFTDEGGQSCVIELFLDSNGFHFHGISDASNELFYNRGGIYDMMQKNREAKKMAGKDSQIITSIDIRLD